jgi:hypothetical protein
VSVDAKAGERWKDTGNHDVETAAVRSLSAWTVYSGNLSYFVFSDFRCATPSMAIDLGRPGSFRGNGSGTPFMLIKATDCVPFDEIFGSYV